MARISEICFGVFVFFILNFIVTGPASAVSVTINSFPSVIDSLDSYTIEASISGATNATNYLRADLYKDGSNNYFGETYNGSDWYNGGDGKSYYPIQIQNSSASASFYFQLGNPTTVQYPGPGSYKLKIRRYTSSGSASSNDSQTPVDVQINYIFLTPTPEPTPTPTNPPITPTPVPTPPPKTPTPTPVSTPTPTSTPNITSVPAVVSNNESTTSSNVLGVSNINLSSPPPIFAVSMIFIGAVVIVMSIYFGFKIYKTPKVQNDI